MKNQKVLTYAYLILLSDSTRARPKNTDREIIGCNLECADER